MSEIPVTFRSGELQLEGLMASPTAASGAAVVCHPHPTYGGSMHNNVVEAVLDALWRRGYATLRFNFRGVGESEGEYDGGQGEADDARAAVSFLAERAAVKAVTLAGYSFGASVAMRAGLADAAIDRVIAVALPIAMTNSGVGGPAAKPVLLVSGDCDSYSPVDPLRALALKLGDAAHLEIIGGADHFFGGDEPQLSAVIAGALGDR
ncbi:MAG TPA: alpha/beta fold hydrolase [Candidatus Binataceae bacterium]|nr:alpha/beta fold hydrolase [Candidatus Binataceae bacterium]